MAVVSVSAGLAAIVVAAVAFSLLILDHSHPPANEAGTSTSSLLVVTWGPSLCKVDPSNSGCRTGHVGKLGERLILHGLWPQPPSQQFCGVPKTDKARDLRNADMSSLDLPEDLQSKLQPVLSDAALMAPHEWYTHGTCSGVTPAVYFRDAITLTNQVSKILDPVFAEHPHLSLNTVRHRFDAEFGEGAGKRVSLTCRDVDGEQVVIYEVHLSLPPIADFGSAENTENTENTLSLGDLLVKGPTISPGCRRGRVP
ncbi:ribonuclease T2 family protein [Mycobacterium spongiae]|uniref:ribonuclease T2 family protein n=1 Tax=Mycobacterium spongiae TaxID=886343 RepID=UPI001FE83584|nr:ribonuclease T(2) [Mycobacterium spongiae]